MVSRKRRSSGDRIPTRRFPLVAPPGREIVLPIRVVTASASGLFQSVLAAPSADNGFIMQHNDGKGAPKNEQLLVPGSHINKHFMLRALISAGGFGQVYSGVNVNSGQPVAIKAESMNAKIGLLRIEANCLETLNRSIRQLYTKPPKEPIPNYYGYGETHNVRYMVMDLCGRNIRELKKSLKEDRFSMTTSLWVMKKMIQSLRFLHQLGWIHRDVKPANFCVGIRAQGGQELYLIDFGMARHFIGRNGMVKTRRESSPFHGTVRYASLTTHYHQDMSRFDDLWSVYYICVENMVGQLPWRYVNEKKDVEKMKETTDLLKQKYGEEPGPPASLVVLHRHLRQASFYNEPRYDQINNEIELDMIQRNFSMGDRLDWQPEQQKTIECNYRAITYQHRCGGTYKAAKQEDDDESYYFVDGDEVVQ
ncbi:putative serine/threonine-protein kinase [Toxocara canis]|uniref:Putative serine/threonine-protein kinase n=1 Tax=Toxocara canis TaxID=6265 RepID=A0A0B2VLJ4_TOXCA|nr:putative serine/threonine-protein kinase [Toxocara canis]